MNLFTGLENVLNLYKSKLSKISKQCYQSHGPDLVVLHGLFGMSDNWRTHAKYYSVFKVHAIDQRNHGKSFHNHNNSYGYV